MRTCMYTQVHIHLCMYVCVSACVCMSISVCVYVCFFPFPLIHTYIHSIDEQAMCICTLMGSLQSFASLQLFSPMQNLLTEAGLYWTYSCTAGVGIVYTLLFLQETSGASVG